MNSSVNEKIENIYKIHGKNGFKGVVEFWLDHMMKVLKKFPNKPSPKDSAAMEEFVFVRNFAEMKDSNWLTPFDKVSNDWLDSGYDDICFSEVLKSYYNYLNPEKLLCFPAKDIIEIIKRFKEEARYNDEDLNYWKYKLEEGEFIVVDKNITTETNNNTKIETPKPKLLPPNIMSELIGDKGV